MSSARLRASSASSCSLTATRVDSSDGSCGLVSALESAPSVCGVAPSGTSDEAPAAGLRLPIVLLMPLYGVSAGIGCSTSSDAVVSSLTSGGDGVGRRFWLPIVRLMPFDDGATVVGSVSDSDTVVSSTTSGGEEIGLRFRLPTVRLMPFDGEGTAACSSSISDAVASSIEGGGEGVGLLIRLPIVLLMPFEGTLADS